MLRFFVVVVGGNAVNDGLFGLGKANWSLERSVWKIISEKIC